MSWNVFVTRRIPEPGLELLRNECQIEVNPHDRVLTREELLGFVKGRSGLLTLLTDKIDSAVMDATGSQLKVISNYAVGYDNIDLKEAKSRGIVVTNTPGVLTETTADLTWALIMAIARRIVEGDAFTRAGKYKAWDPLLLLGGDIFGKTLGFIGFGRIGQAVARRAKGFNMKLLVYHPKKSGVVPDFDARYVSLSDLLKESDFVSIHAPLTQETRHLIGGKELRSMKSTAYLTNTARGPIVDEAALAKALKDKWIAGAALDVYEEEPKIHPGLLDLSNVILAPHIGSASLETRTKMALIAAENLLAVLKGKEPLHRVN